MSGETSNSTTEAGVTNALARLATAYENTSSFAGFKKALTKELLAQSRASAQGGVSPAQIAAGVQALEATRAGDMCNDEELVKRILEATSGMKESLVGDAERPAGLPFGIIDPDYARVFTQARIIAWQYGFACVMHGSFTRDLDLLLVPWESRASANYDQLLKMIAEACDLKFRDGEEVLKATVDWSEKPHGRKASSLFFPGFADRRWVDISVMPALTATDGKKATE